VNDRHGEETLKETDRKRRRRDECRQVREQREVRRQNTVTYKYGEGVGGYKRVNEMRDDRERQTKYGYWGVELVARFKSLV
jgi:hypothetical protein